MIPVLLQVGFVKIYTFGLFLVLAFFWAAYYLWKNIRLTSFKEDEVFDGLFFSLLGGALFGRLVHVIFNFQDFGFNFLKFILVNGYPGFSIWGWILGFFLFLYLFSNSRKIDFGELVDYFIPPIFIALAIGKIGSFFSGVEVGAVTSLPIGLKYAAMDGARHLTPLYEGLLLFLGTYFSHRILFAIRRDRLSRGFLLLFFLWFFSGVHFAFDLIRGEQTMLMGYSVYGVITLILLLTLSLYFLYYFKTALLQPLFRIFRKK